MDSDGFIVVQWWVSGGLMAVQWRSNDGYCDGAMVVDDGEATHVEAFV